MPYWVDQLINRPACELPCWENITPGETYIQEVSSLLSKIPESKDITIPLNVSEHSAFVKELRALANQATCRFIIATELFVSFV
jgi:hypothetical protein